MLAIRQVYRTKVLQQSNDSFQGICIYLQARKDTGDFEHFHAIRLFDDILEDLVKKCSQGGDVVDKTGMHRFLMCPACMVKGRNQFFVKVGRGFEPQNPNERCRSLVHEDFAQSQDFSSEDEGSDSEDEDHTVDERQRILIKDEEEKDSALGEFLKKGIQTIPKKPFRELESDLQVGQQIWIYRDGRTNPYNPVAVLMPYAHVAVYVGLEGGKKKVVHVSKASALKGVMTATIEKVSLARVIKPEDLGKSFIPIIFCLPSFSFCSFPWPRNPRGEARIQRPRSNCTKSKRFGEIPTSLRLRPPRQL